MSTKKLRQAHNSINHKRVFHITTLQSSLLSRLLLITSISISTTSAVSLPPTYHLSYDALISPFSVQLHALNPINNIPVDQPQARLVPPTIAEEATHKIGVDLLRQWIDYKYTLGETTVLGKDLGGGECPVGLSLLSTGDYWHGWQ